jgi:hypothetical protein
MEASYRWAGNAVKGVWVRMAWSFDPPSKNCLTFRKVPSTDQRRRSGCPSRDVVEVGGETSVVLFTGVPDDDEEDLTVCTDVVPEDGAAEEKELLEPVSQTDGLAVQPLLWRAMARACRPSSPAPWPVLLPGPAPGSCQSHGTRAWVHDDTGGGVIAPRTRPLPSTPLSGRGTGPLTWSPQRVCSL